MTDTDELYTVSCINCNGHVFKFSKNLLERTNNVYLKCPKCCIETYIHGSNDHVQIEKYQA